MAMNRCLLCLESTVYNECCIPINSTEWQDLNIENIIEIHLWSVVSYQKNKELSFLFQAMLHLVLIISLIVIEVL